MEVSVVAGQAAFPPHAQSAPHSKKAALASPIHFPSLSPLPYNLSPKILPHTRVSLYLLVHARHVFVFTASPPLSRSQIHFQAHFLHHFTFAHSKS
ncbi:HMG box domain-containing protein [Fusarium sp. Ph1]|nr:HMG box domain-containing protein [Fusarium sp. Ph1]